MFSILIIDDEKNVREGLAHFIGNLDGFTVCGTASDGAEALNMCVRLQPDLILTDINMPKVDGLAFISRLRERSANTPIIVISGYDYFSYVQQALRMGVKDYLLKPVNRGELERLLRRVRDETEAGKAEQASVDPAAGKADPVEVCKETIQRRYSDPSLDIEQLAQELFLSPSHLRALFKQRTGMSFVRYLSAYRMELAAEMLTSTCMQIQDIAAAVSYEDAHYFANCCRKYTGVSASAWREKNSTETRKDSSNLTPESSVFLFDRKDLRHTIELQSAGKAQK